ncbi:MAG: CHASE3 domain-containing protein, partial [Pirellulaceae bacterium]
MSSNRASQNLAVDKSNIWLPLGAGTVLAAFLIGGFLAYRNTELMSRNANLVTRTHETLTALEDILSLNRDAETGQRGYLITGDDRYLEPYNVAVKEIQRRLEVLETLFRDDPELATHLPALRAAASAKLQELAMTIELRRNRGFEAAQAVVITDRGREYMMQIRNKIDTLEQLEAKRRADRLAEATRARNVAVTTSFITTGIGVVLSLGVAYLL